MDEKARTKGEICLGLQLPPISECLYNELSLITNISLFPKQFVISEFTCTLICMFYRTDIIVLAEEDEKAAPDTEVAEEVAHPFDKDDDEITFNTPLTRDPDAAQIEDIGYVFDFHEGKFSISISYALVWICLLLRFFFALFLHNNTSPL